MKICNLKSLKLETNPANDAGTPKKLQLAPEAMQEQGHQGLGKVLWAGEGTVMRLFKLVLEMALEHYTCPSCHKVSWYPVEWVLEGGSRWRRVFPQAGFLDDIMFRDLEASPPPTNCQYLRIQHDPKCHADFVVITVAIAFFNFQNRRQSRKKKKKMLPRAGAGAYSHISYVCCLARAFWSVIPNGGSQMRTHTCAVSNVWSDMFMFSLCVLSWVRSGMRCLMRVFVDLSTVFTIVHCVFLFLQ